MPLHGEPFTGPIQKPRSRAAEKKKADREKDTHWRAVRQAVLVRDHWRCRCCGTPEKVDVHHIRFRSMGGEDSTNNCIAACRECHCEMHAYRLFIHGNDANKRLRFERTK